MAIYPKTEHLKIPMICSSSLGIFPWEFMFQENPFIQSCYAVYSKLMLSYYIFFLLTAYIQLIMLLTSEVPRMDEISGNLCITLIYTITIIRQLIIKLHPGFKNIIKQIIDTEKIINSQEDIEVKKIYHDCAKDTSSKCKVYLTILFIITMLYIFRPLVVHGYEKEIGNSTVFIKALPLSSWFPFDEQTLYLAAYLWHILDSLVGASFVTYTDILMFSLIVYPTGQLKILQYILRNFEIYKQKIQKDYRIENVDVAAFVTFRECINEHKKIIQYVDYFNASMNALMVFDFLQSSLQIATILTQVLGNKITLMLLAFVGAFFIGMILRLFLYYYYANEVVLLSCGLANSLWESTWYEQAPKVKFMMFIFIMMVQKSLKLKIGPFSVMSLDSFISILKATYSYIMLMYGTN
nr:odorant receptor 10 [Pachyrhinus yasumatsui]